MMTKKLACMLIVSLIVFAFVQCTWATVTEHDLTISIEPVNITGHSVMCMTINGQIPGPTLYFKEGDTARIHVHNKMDVETSIHWHGLLVPNNMDGVPYLTYPPIKPGTTFTYEFPIRQAGTYWYHSHTMLQEQVGLYGSIVIEAREKRPATDRDHVIVLSDWSDEDPHAILRTLKRGSDWYSIEKGSAQSVVGAARLGRMGGYFKRELQRMPAMDIADVAYDRFLANGKPESALPGNPGETIRLRIINGSSSSFFLLTFAGGPMTIVAADGQDVAPVPVDRLLIGVAETYDVLIKAPDKGAYEFRATAHDGSGFSSTWIGSGQRHAAPAVPKPDLYHTMGSLSLEQIFAPTPAGAMGMENGKVAAGLFDRPGMAGMSDMKMDQHDHSNMGGMKMDHSGAMKNMHQPLVSNGDVIDRSGKRFGSDFRPLASDVSSSPDLAPDGMDPRRPWPPYHLLRATTSTAFPAGKPVRDVRLTLDGDMVMSGYQRQTPLR